MIEDLIKSRRLTFFWLFLVIPLLTFIALRHSLKLALFGDDWLQLWIIKFQFGVNKVLDPTSIRSYLGPYSPQYAILGILSHFFGYNPFPFYFVSMILRILAAIGIYFIALELTKNKLAALVSSAFFGASAISLDTTNWVFNMNSYLGITALAPFMIFLIRSRVGGWGRFFLSWVFFMLAPALVPVRMHGVFLIVAFSDFLWFLRNLKPRTFIQVLIRQSCFVVGAFWLNSFSVFGNLSSSWDYRWKDNLSFLFSSIAKGNKPELGFSLFVNVGNMITSLVVRQTYEFADFLRTFLGANPTVSSIGPLFFLFVLSVIVASFYLPKKKKLFIFGCISLGAVWTLLNEVYLVTNLENPLPKEILISSLIGGYFSIVLLGFYLVFFDQKKRLADALLFSLFWIYAFLVIPWFWQPSSLFTAEHRYLITSGAGVALSLGCLLGIVDQCLKIKLGKLIKKNSRLKLTQNFLIILPVAALSFLFFNNISASNSYFKWLVRIRGAKVYQRVWGSLVSQVPSLDKENVSVFFFTSTGQGPDLHDVITFGFPPRMGIIYDIAQPMSLPIPVDDFKELVSIVTDGQSLKRFGHEPNPIPLERVYAFELRGSKLVNIRQEVVARLKEVIAAGNTGEK